MLDVLNIPILPKLIYYSNAKQNSKYLFSWKLLKVVLNLYENIKGQEYIKQK